jgi:hypothetical protein
MIRQRSVALAAVLATVLSATAQAETGATQFSAEMVRRGPDGQVTSGKMFVGDGRTRMEMSQQGREVIRIGDQKRRMEWILFPAEQNYLERGAPPGAEGAQPPKQPSAEANPCDGMPGVSCRRVGVEDVNGRPAVKWEMSAIQEGQTLTGAQWLDQERGLPLKSVMPDGPTMELQILGQETIDGRRVEKWEVTMTAPNQQPSRTFQWYDPELELAVREEFPGGYVSELKNIRVGPQPDDLFSVPAGYTRMTVPEGGQQPPKGSR